MSAENSPARRWKQMHRIMPIYTRDGVILGPRPFPGLEQTMSAMNKLENSEAADHAKQMEKNILAEAKKNIEAIKQGVPLIDQQLELEKI